MEKMLNELFPLLIKVIEKKAQKNKETVRWKKIWNINKGQRETKRSRHFSLFLSLTFIVE